MYMDRAKAMDRRAHGTVSPTDRMLVLLREAATVLTVTAIDVAAGDHRYLGDRLGLIAVNLTTAMAYLGFDIGMTLDTALINREMAQMQQGRSHDDTTERTDAVHGR